MERLGLAVLWAHNLLVVHEISIGNLMGERLNPKHYLTLHILNSQTRDDYSINTSRNKKFNMSGHGTVGRQFCKLYVQIMVRKMAEWNIMIIYECNYHVSRNDSNDVKLIIKCKLIGNIHEIVEQLYLSAIITRQQVFRDRRGQSLKDSLTDFKNDVFTSRKLVAYNNIPKIDKQSYLSTCIIGQHVPM